MINSIFGIGTMIDIDGENMPCIFISDKEIWDRDECCSDGIDAEDYKSLCNLGFAEEQEGIWTNTNPINLPINYHKVLVDAGFTYNKTFEKYMQVGR